MIISVEKLKTLIDVGNLTDERISMILNGIESYIRRETNNHFHVKNIRFLLMVNSTGQLVGNFNHLSIGDTIEISDSQYNANHIASITNIAGDVITLDNPLNEEDLPVEITKVVYPADVVQGVVNLLNWEVNFRDKAGIKSESISRHSVTYYDSDNSNQKFGYPASLMDFIKSYRKARF